MGSVAELIGIGNALKKAREEFGFSLEEMHKKTNIQIDYLQLLEEERFDQLPSPFYARGFLRAYAKSLKLDWRHLLDLYEKSQVEHSSEELTKSSLHAVANSKLPSESGYPPIQAERFPTKRQLTIKEIQQFAPRRDIFRAKERKRKKKMLWWSIVPVSIILLLLVVYVYFRYN